MTAGNLTPRMSLSLHEFKDTTLNRFILLEGFLQMVHRNSDGSARELHTAVRRCVRRSDQMQAADEALSAHHPNLSGKAERCDRENRREA